MTRSCYTNHRTRLGAGNMTVKMSCSVDFPNGEIALFDACEVDWDGDPAHAIFLRDEKGEETKLAPEMIRKLRITLVAAP